MIGEAQATEDKIDELDISKLRNFYASRDTIKKVRTQPKEWEKNLANHVSDKGLVSILYQCNDKRKNNSVMKLLCNLFMGLKNFKQRVEPSNALTALTNSEQARFFSL